MLRLHAKVRVLLIIPDTPSRGNQEAPRRVKRVDSRMVTRIATLIDGPTVTRIATLIDDPTVTRIATLIDDPTVTRTATLIDDPTVTRTAAHTIEVTTGSAVSIFLRHAAGTPPQLAWFIVMAQRLTAIAMSMTTVIFF